MSNLKHIAIVSDSKSVKIADLAPAAAALQIQVLRDFAPAWKRPATVASFAKLGDVPTDHWPVVVRDDIPYKAQGIHLDKDGSPFALVLYSDGWSLTSSHEVLEMLGDPLGKRTKLSRSIKPGQGDVKYLVEVCDPCEADQFAYTINGVTVSDFYTPAYFDRKATKGKTYSFTGALAKPLQVLEGGYISWQDPKTKHWWQQTYFGSTPSFKDLGVFATGKNPRRSSDGVTDVPEQSMAPAPSRAGAQFGAAVDGARADRANYLHERITEIVSASN